MMLLLLTLIVANQDAVWQVGNDAYRDGDFKKAITQYEQLIDDGVKSGRVYYNLGNAYFKAGELGPALLNYYRAEKLMPGDDDIRQNIEMANETRRDPVIESERAGLGMAVDKFFFGLSYQHLFLIAFVLLCVAGLAAIPLSLGKKHRVWGYVLVIAGVLGLALGAVTMLQYQRLTANDAAVVMVNQTDVLAGPAPSEPVNFTIHEGIRCQILEQQPGWYRIRLANGYNGWLPQSDVEKI